jgi:hypothetical protein
MGGIFISYRRGDDQALAGRLFDRLGEAFGRERLFMDVDSIAPGLDFLRVVEEHLGQCDIVLTVIGKGWLDARPRLDDPQDFVRIEIETTLNQEKRVIPVLVDEARMPRADELPEAIRPLARRNAVRLTHERFRTDTQALITALQNALKEEGERKRRSGERQRRAQAEERRGLRRATVLAFWPPRPVPLVASLVGVAVLGAVAVWIVNAPPSEPVPGGSSSGTSAGSPASVPPSGTSGASPVPGGSPVSAPPSGTPTGGTTAGIDYIGSAKH